jgi:flagellar FliJ protein
MKKFKFRLQTLLKIREQAEKDRQKAHAAALNQVHNQEDRLGGIRDESSRTTADQQTRMVGRIRPNQMSGWARYVQKLRRDTIMGTELLSALEKGAEEKRLELVDASKQRKIFENLRDRLREHHDKDVEARAIKENDEISLGVYRQGQRKTT